METIADVNGEIQKWKLSGKDVKVLNDLLGVGIKPGERGLMQLQGALGSLQDNLQQADMPPTAQALAGYKELKMQVGLIMERWRKLKM
jgi:hypothetical protein